MKLSAKEITVFGIFAALMYVAQVVMSFIPNVHLTSLALESSLARDDLRLDQRDI